MDLQPNFEIVPGTKIKCKNFLHDGRIYVKDKVGKNVLYLRCKKYRICEGRAKIVNNQLQVLNAEHTCGVTSQNSQAQKLKDQLKRASTTEPDDLRSIFNRTVFNSQDGAASVSFVQAEASMKLARTRRFPQNVTTPEEVISFLEGQSLPEISRLYHGSVDYTSEGKFKTEL